MKDFLEAVYKGSLVLGSIFVVSEFGNWFDPRYVTESLSLVY